MNRVISTFFMSCTFFFVTIVSGTAQTVIGTFSDTVYLLSVFHNSGKKDNKAENYYCAVFLNKESAIDNLLPLKTEECMHIRFETHDISVGKYTFVRPNNRLQQLIDEEVGRHFVGNACIGAGWGIFRACSQYLDGKEKTAPYYSFIVDTLFNSPLFKKHFQKPDMLMGEITNPLLTGGLMIGWGDRPPRGPWVFDYEKKGTYYKLFKLRMDYLLFDDPNVSVLGKSYEGSFHPGVGEYDGVQNVCLLLGDCGSPFISHLKGIPKDGKILTALPYSVVKLTEK